MRKDANGAFIQEGSEVVVHFRVKRIDGAGNVLLETQTPMDEKTGYYPSLVVKASQTRRLTDDQTTQTCQR